MDQDGRLGIHGNTLPLHLFARTVRSVAWRDERNSVRATSTKEGWHTRIIGYEPTYFSYRPSNEPSNLQAPRFFAAETVEVVTMRSLLCAREFAIQCSLRDRKGVQLSPLFFLIYGECMRKTAELPRKRGPSIRLPSQNRKLPWW